MLYDSLRSQSPTMRWDDEQARSRAWENREKSGGSSSASGPSARSSTTRLFVMLYLFKCWDPSRAPLFQTGWFVESIMTQKSLFISFARIDPLLPERASWPLPDQTFTIMASSVAALFPLASSLASPSAAECIAYPLLTLLPTRAFAGRQSLL